MCLRLKAHKEWCFLLQPIFFNLITGKGKKRLPFATSGLKTLQVAMVKTLQGYPSVSYFSSLFFTPVQWLPPPPDPCIWQALQTVCVRVYECVCSRKGERERKKREWKGKRARRSVYMGVLYVWREGSLVEEVASHKSQLMSITHPEPHSSVHTRAYSPTALSNLWTPRALGKFPPSHTHCEVCPSLKKTPHRCQDGHPDAYTLIKCAPTNSYTHAFHAQLSAAHPRAPGWQRQAVRRRWYI